MRVERKEFEAAVDKYADILFRCAYTYCGNRADAEDVVQETFIKYLKKSPSFNDEAHEKAWLIRVAVNLSKDLMKSYWYKNKSELIEDITDENDANDKCDIWESVSHLPPKYKIVTELYFHEGYTIKEIAEIIGAKQSTVGDRLTKAKKMLSESLKEV